jgi:hypothetical protein
MQCHAARSLVRCNEAGCSLAVCATCLAAANYPGLHSYRCMEYESSAPIDAYDSNQHNAPTGLMSDCRSVLVLCVHDFVFVDCKSEQVSPLSDILSQRSTFTCAKFLHAQCSLRDRRLSNNLTLTVPHPHSLGVFLFATTSKSKAKKNGEPYVSQSNKHSRGTAYA